MSTVTTRERPIIFSAPMVRAILDGRKTQTRRPVKGEPRVRLLDRVRGDFPFHRVNACAGVHAARLNKHGAVSVLADDCENELGVKPGEFEWLCPYGIAGDRLLVRETWAVIGMDRGERARPGNAIAYRADNLAEPSVSYCWRPSIFMPRWASRITLEVVSVRVERLREMSIDDVAAEGFTFNGEQSYAQQFSDGWNALYAKKPELQWSANPWVWVVEFKRVGGAS